MPFREHGRRALVSFVYPNGAFETDCACWETDVTDWRWLLRLPGMLLPIPDGTVGRVILVQPQFAVWDVSNAIVSHEHVDTIFSASGRVDCAIGPGVPFSINGVRLTVPVDSSGNRTGPVAEFPPRPVKGEEIELPELVKSLGKPEGNDGSIEFDAEGGFRFRPRQRSDN